LDDPRTPGGRIVLKAGKYKTVGIPNSRFSVSNPECPCHLFKKFIRFWKGSLTGKAVV